MRRNKDRRSSDYQWDYGGMDYSSSSSDDPWPASEQGLRDRPSELCDDARLQCTVRTGCQMALNNFFQGCRSVMSGEERYCTRPCKHALLSLLSTEDDLGLAFINCHCGDDQECRLQKERVEICQRHVMDSMDLVLDDEHKNGGTQVSCSFARWLCEADTSCLTALRYYVRHCGKLFSGQRCTARCRNSIHILYRQPNAHKLRSCRCEGDEAYNCNSLMDNTQRLCFERHRQQQHQHQHPKDNHRHHNNNSDDEEADDDLDDDDSSTMNVLTNPEAGSHVPSTFDHHLIEDGYVSDVGSDDDEYMDYGGDDYDDFGNRRSKGTQRHYSVNHDVSSLKSGRLVLSLCVLARWLV